MSVPVLLSLLFACQLGLAPVRDAGEERERASGPPVHSLGDAPEAEEREPTVTEEAAGEFPEDTLSDWIFTLDTIHEVALEISPESEAALAAAPYSWALASVTIDGEALPNIGVRLRGKIGSFRTLAGKPKFKLGFNEFVPGQRFYGLEELSLNNAVVDCSYMKEVVGYRLYAAAGVPTLRTSYAQVTVNGAPYGLYVLLETPNDRWLARTFPDSYGNLYDGKYVWYGGYNYTLLDFGIGVDALYQLEEGTDVGNADIAAVSAALLGTQGTPAFNDTMGAVFDWDAFHRLTAVDQFFGHNDGYSMNTNNYRVYFDPRDGKAEILVWDLDYTFLYDYQWGMSWYTPFGNVTYACWQDPTCSAAHRVAVSEFLAAYEAEDWTTLLDEVEALTFSATQLDPRRECLASDVQPTRDYIRAYLAGAPASLRAWWGL